MIYAIGSEVYVSPTEERKSYAGDGILKAIDYERDMGAVYFPGKGIVWFKLCFIKSMREVSS